MIKEPKIQPGTQICCSECRNIVGECVITPIMGMRTNELVNTCFTGFTSRDPPICNLCGGSFYKPKMGFFTREHGWCW